MAYNFIDLFAGCGGLSEGFLQTGHYRALAHVEWEKPMVDTLRNRLVQQWNHTEEDARKKVVLFDIQKTDELINGNWTKDSIDKYGTYNHDDVVNGGLRHLVGNHHVHMIIGGPPCQAYSIHGRATSNNNMDKFQEAICAFANGLFGSRKRGYLILRAYDDGGKTGGKVGGDVPSLSQALSLVLSPVCPQLSEVQLKKMVSVIDYLFRASGSITELMDCAGEKNKSRFRQTIHKPLVDIGLVELTIKDVPNSPKQKYALTDEGRDTLQTIS